jgi:vitamin B12 transporter
MKMKFIIILLALAAGQAGAQEPAIEAVSAPGGVQLVLVDPAGVPWAGLAGAEIRLSREGAEAAALTRIEGAFVASGLAPGPWTLEVTAPGFPSVRGSIEVPPGEVLHAEVVLDPAAEDLEELVVVARTEAEVLARSAQAVTVVETEAAQTQSADLGEVLARTQGVGVRRAGGLGSGARFSLGGLTDDQVRFFLDGVPLELAGHPLGLSNVPVDLVQRVEVYRGVVPVRFGADALGGAVNLVSEGGPSGVGGSLSYQGGAFDTHRLAAHLHASAGWGGFVRAQGYLDAARNDYTVDVEVPDERGRLSPAEVRRFHDAYRARGASVELGVADRGWAELLSLRAFGSGYGQQLQHNVVMTVPYGEASYAVNTQGATARYRQPLSQAVELDLLAGYTASGTAFRDRADCVYDWFGQCVRERAVPGEISTPATDQVVRDDAGVARLLLSWRPGPAHGFTLSVAPTAFSRSGEDLLHDGVGRDPLTARRDAVQVVSGLEHQLDVLDDRLQNMAFVKHYLQAVRSEEPLPGGQISELGRDTSRLGLGEGVRWAIGSQAWAKASWEWATRLPAPEEVFGDAVLVLDNLELQPETSHNANLGLTFESDSVRLDANGFLRDARDLIVLLGNDRSFTWFNVYGSRSAGLEAAAGWTSPGRWVSVDANGTWMSLRNTSQEGAFADFAGDRIPNRPWLLLNSAVTLGASDVVAPSDRLTLDLYSRYVHEFFRGWESVGLLEFKQVVPTQLSHTAAITYAVEREDQRVAASVEIQNLTDTELYDFFGVQRPGRAVYGKVSLAW